MRDKLNQPLTVEGKGHKNTKSKKGKSFGYQVLGFGAGVKGPTPFIEATGGNAIVTNGDYKMHIFTGPGTFDVTGMPATPADKIVDYFVVAGGGGSGSQGGGAGGGGFRVSNSLGCISASPLANSSGIEVAAQGYPITVGAGGAADACANGENSVFSSITSTGGGTGGGWNASPSPKSGGSGGGGSSGPGTFAGGTGNTPPTTPPQGKDGGSAASPNAGGGGGGASAVGQNTTGSLASGGDGSYFVNDFVGPTAPSYGQTGPAGRYFSGGGGGGIRYPCISPSSSSAGLGGGGYSIGGSASVSGTVNTGGGGGGGSWSGPTGGTAGGAGGSGIVVIKYKYQ